MLTKELEKTKECCFYSGEYHLEMMLLPYINKKIKDNNFVILTEKNLENSILNLLNKINIKKEIKEKIYKINWNNNYLEKILKIEKYIKEDKDITIFINGDEKFNKFIKNELHLYSTNINIIDCFDIEKISKKEINKISQRYSNVLNVEKISI